MHTVKLINFSESSKYNTNLVCSIVLYFIGTSFLRFLFAKIILTLSTLFTQVGDPFTLSKNIVYNKDLFPH